MIAGVKRKCKEEPTSSNYLAYISSFFFLHVRPYSTTDMFVFRVKHGIKVTDLILTVIEVLANVLVIT